ncbi:MAG TPA: vWA domain-containing protein [Oligoflexia bacterium]|nr:vWA domain-containing protein [Oligoflexia bacterium]HMR25286.1 vWA domain-containing protein [Oligoflexia bacterium]
MQKTIKQRLFTSTWLRLIGFVLILMVQHAHAQIYNQDKVLCVQADFVFVIDISGSVSSEATKEVVDAFMAEIDRYEVDENAIRIGFIVFNDGVVYEQQLTGDEETIHQSITNITSLVRGSGTNILEALEKAKTMFEQSFYERPAEIHRGMILLSDGDPLWHAVLPAVEYDLEDVKQQPFFYKEGVGMFVGGEAKIAQGIEQAKHSEIQLSRQIQRLSDYFGFDQKVEIFTLNIAEPEQPMDEQHPHDLASPQPKQDGFVLDAVEHYLGKSYVELIQWIDSLSICN